MKKMLRTALTILVMHTGIVHAVEDPRFVIPDFGVGGPLDVINKTFENLSMAICETLPSNVIITIGSAQSLACSVVKNGSPVLVRSLSNTTTNKVGMRQSALQIEFLMDLARTDEVDFRSSMKSQCEKNGGKYSPGKIESCRLADFWRLSWDALDSGLGWKIESDWY